MLVRIRQFDAAPAPPPAGEAHVWLAKPDALPWSLEELASLLTPDERDRAARYKAGTVREQFTASRGLLRKLLGECLGTAPHAVPITYVLNGKPVLACQSLHFNVSHTHGLMMIALAPRRIGADVERTRAVPDAAGLVGRFFSPAEQDQYRRLPEACRERAFFRGWVCKEAVIKAAGATVQYLDAFDVDLNPDRPAGVLAVRHESLASAGWMVSDWQPEPGFAAALAVEGPGELRFG
ncbi:MAG: 4'-phosphopantetheinyl transferase superfamily protein [Gemmataceae bacterium]